MSKISAIKIRLLNIPRSKWMEDERHVARVTIDPRFKGFCSLEKTKIIFNSILRMSFSIESCLSDYKTESGMNESIKYTPIDIDEGFEFYVLILNISYIWIF